MEAVVGEDPHLGLSHFNYISGNSFSSVVCVDILEALKGGKACIKCRTTCGSDPRNKCSCAYFGTDFAPYTEGGLLHEHLLYMVRPVRTL